MSPAHWGHALGCRTPWCSTQGETPAHPHARSSSVVLPRHPHALGAGIRVCSLSVLIKWGTATASSLPPTAWSTQKWGWCCRTDFGGQAGSVWYMVTANAELLRCHRCHSGPWRRMLMVGCVELLLAHPPAPSHTSGPVCAVESSEKCHGQSVFARGWGRSSSCEAQMTFGRGSSHCSQA